MRRKKPPPKILSFPRKRESRMLIKQNILAHLSVIQQIEKIPQGLNIFSDDNTFHPYGMNISFTFFATDISSLLDGLEIEIRQSMKEQEIPTGEFFLCFV